MYLVWVPMCVHVYVCVCVCARACVRACVPACGMQSSHAVLHKYSQTPSSSHVVCAFFPQMRLRSNMPSVDLLSMNECNACKAVALTCRCLFDYTGYNQSQLWWKWSRADRVCARGGWILSEWNVSNARTCADIVKGVLRIATPTAWQWSLVQMSSPWPCLAQLNEAHTALWIQKQVELTGPCIHVMYTVHLFSPWLF